MATDLIFTNYLGQVCIEKAKALLLDRNRRVSEVVYDVGFQSLTHVHKIVGQSPTAYRHLSLGRK
jgi:YesN/AraC family two-component response regulator